MKMLAFLTAVAGIIACTPFERDIAEEVLHEATVAEEAIERDLSRTTYQEDDDCPGCQNQSATKNGPTSPQNASPMPGRVIQANTRQYPRRSNNEKRYPKENASKNRGIV